MATSFLRELTEPAGFVPEVAKQHGVFLCATALEVLQQFGNSSIECFNKDLPKPPLVLPTEAGLEGPTARKQSLHI